MELMPASQPHTSAIARVGSLSHTTGRHQARLVWFCFADDEIDKKDWCQTLMCQPDWLARRQHCIAFIEETIGHQWAPSVSLGINASPLQHQVLLASLSSASATTSFCALRLLELLVTTYECHKAMSMCHRLVCFHSGNFTTILIGEITTPIRL